MLQLKPISQQPKLLCAGLFAVLTLIANPVRASATQQWQQQALGATLQLDLQGISAAEFAAAQPTLQQKLTALLQQLDPNSQSSALSQLNQQGTMPAADSALLQLLHRCEHWYQQHGGYSCRLGSIRQQWQRAQLQNQLPDRVVLRQQTRQLQLSKPAEALQNRQIHWDFNGLDQAFLVEQLQLWCREIFPHHTGLRLQLGDVMVAQGAPQAITLPWQVTHHASSPLLHIQLKQAALAYSQRQGSYRLSYRSYSPVLHPAEGWPMEYGPQVAVVAPTASDAWLLAQSLAVLPPDKHSQLLAATQGYSPSTAPAAAPSAALLNSPTETSTVLQPSAQWFSWLADHQQWQPQAAMQLQYQIRPQPAVAKRPYLAIWISTTDQQFVRQLSLQGQQARWYQELRQWWRRIGKPAELPLDSLAGATRKAGSYSLEWDGRDEQGKPVPPGDYVLHLEIAREHGEHEKLSVPLQFEAGSNGNTSGRLELGDIQWQVKSAQIVQASSSRSN